MSTKAYKRVLRLLHGLLDGTHPLPPPHPQQLSFTKDEVAISRLAEVVECYVNGRSLPDDDVRHLLFKLAAWLIKKGAVQGAHVTPLVSSIFPALDLARSRSPEWLRSKAGIGWAVRRFDEWRRAAASEARRNTIEPRSVAHIGFAIGAVPSHLVELTNAAHVYAEGRAMHNCMAWSVNLEAAKKRGDPAAGDPTFLECLTYAVKLRSGELRLFSARSAGTGHPVMTIGYMPRLKMVTEVSEGAWTLYKCAALRTLSAVVDVKVVQCVPERCLSACPHNGWCQKVACSDRD